MKHPLASPLKCVVLAAALLAATVGCSSSDGSSDSSDGPAATTPADPDAGPLDPRPLTEKTKIVASTAAKLEYVAPMLLAEEYGEFDKENLDVDIQVTQTAQQAITTGQVDAAQTAPEASWINAINSGVNVRWVAGNYLPPENATSGLWVKKDKVGDPVDLTKVEGLKIAASQPPGAVVSYFIDQLLADTGLTVNDVEIVKLAPADTLIALENGSVDGAWLIDPLQNEVKDNDDFILAGGAPEDTVGGGLFFGDKMLDPDNKEAADAFIRAMARTIDEYLQPGYHDDEKVVADLAELGGVPEEAITGAEELRFDLEISEGLIEDMQKTWLTQDVLEVDEPLSDDQVVDRSFVESVQGDG